jgi:hypothetical protein
MAYRFYSLFPYKIVSFAYNIPRTPNWGSHAISTQYPFKLEKWVTFGALNWMARSPAIH